MDCKRTGNFSSFEKEIAFALIESHKNVLESKKTDALSAVAKKEAWTEVADQFNAVVGVSKRNAKQLQSWWENQKKRARRNIADNRVKLFATGGGPSEIKSQSDSWDEKVASISSCTLFPLESMFDSDAEYQLTTVSMTS